jgi:O-antigen ligase
MQMVPNLVIYILILFSMFVLIEKPAQVLMIVRTILILTILLFLYRWNVFFIKTGAIYLGLGSIGGSNGVAMTALPAMAICMVGIMLQPAIFSRRMQLFLFGELGFLVVMLIWSQTRGAWLGASVVFFLVLTRINKPRLLLASILMSLFLVGAYYFFQPVIESNTSQTDTTMHAFFGNENYEDINSDDQVRLYSRDAGIKLFWDRPYLGWGVNTFDKLKPKYYEGPSSQLQLPGAFNAWLWILVDMGLIGVVVIAMIFLTPITLAWAKRMYRSEEVGALAFSLALGVVGLSVHLFFVDLIYTSFIWLQVGIAIASVRLVMLGEEIEVSEGKAYNQPMGALN